MLDLVRDDGKRLDLIPRILAVAVNLHGKFRYSTVLSRRAIPEPSYVLAPAKR